MYPSRRTLILAVCLLASASFAALRAAPGLNPFDGSDAEWRERRRELAWQQRRIIVNNDGNDGITLEPGEKKTPEVFLKKRSHGLVGTQVDAIFYCTGVFDLYTHHSAETELRTGWDRGDNFLNWAYELVRTGRDSLEVMTDFGHANSLEVFWSMRMNDTHDSSPERRLGRWKRAHPDQLMGSLADREQFPFGNKRWSSLDYGDEVVREKVFGILRDVATRYDVDGIELDFFRHTVFFRPQMSGEPVTQEHCDLMTNLIRRVRQMTEAVGRARGRPLLVAIRVPDSLGFSKALGLDLATWLTEGLVDIVIGSDYFKLEPWENFVKLCHGYNVPYYACLEARRIQDGAMAAEGATDLKAWRGEAYQAWKAGVDGIYIFNRFDASDPVLREVGDVNLLGKLERKDQTIYVNETLWSKPEVWLKNGRDFVKQPAPSSR